MCIWDCIRSWRCLTVILYKTLDGYIPAPSFDAERARQNRREQKKATA